MTKADRIISELMDALDNIRREAEKEDASRHYIIGVVQGASARCNADRERNRDGYLVVKKDKPAKTRELCTRCDGDGFGPNYMGNCERCGGSGKELR